MSQHTKWFNSLKTRPVGSTILLFFVSLLSRSKSALLELLTLNSHLLLLQVALPWHRWVPLHSALPSHLWTTTYLLSHVKTGTKISVWPSQHFVKHYVFFSDNSVLPSTLVFYRTSAFSSTQGQMLSLISITYIPSLFSYFRI